MSEGIDRSLLFTGLTRPAMIFGVTVDYISICFMTALCAFILADSPLYLLLYVPLHVVGWIGCHMDHHIFKLFFKKLDCQNVANKSIWGCQSYEPS